jgi:hypothetical protein
MALTLNEGLPEELWNDSDSKNAMKQGWDMFAGTHVGDTAEVFEIERDDEAALFETDEDAIAHVVAEAGNGSRIALKAMLLHGQRTGVKTSIPRSLQ